MALLETKKCITKTKIYPADNADKRRKQNQRKSAKSAGNKIINTYENIQKNTNC